MLKLMSLATAGVLTPDEFAGVLHDKMIAGGAGLKRNFVYLKSLMGAKPTVYPAIADVDLRSVSPPHRPPQPLCKNLCREPHLAVLFPWEEVESPANPNPLTPHPLNS
jgi:hypothetical protein